MDHRECFTRGELLRGVDYVFHTACPLFEKPKMSDNEESIRKYVEATQTLIEASVRAKVKKVVFTASASSVVGCHPVKEEGFVYKDQWAWVSAKAINKPNEKAKLLAEKVCWSEIKKQDALPESMAKTTLVTLLPYFMVGPPLYQDLIRTNSSCMAINSILTNE